MSIIFVFLVKDCEKQVSNCIFDTALPSRKGVFQGALHGSAFGDGTDCTSRKTPLVSRQSVRRILPSSARIFNRLQFVTVSFSSAQNTLASTASTDKNADSVFAVGFLSVRYSPTYKTFDRTEWCRFAPFGLRGGDPVYLIVHGQTPRRSERGEGVPLCAVK